MTGKAAILVLLCLLGAAGCATSYPAEYTLAKQPTMVAVVEASEAQLPAGAADQLESSLRKVLWAKDVAPLLARENARDPLRPALANQQELRLKRFFAAGAKQVLWVKVTDISTHSEVQEIGGGRASAEVSVFSAGAGEMAWPEAGIPRHVVYSFEGGVVRTALATESVQKKVIDGLAVKISQLFYEHE